MSTPFENGMYYAFSRPTWILGVFSIVLAIFTNHYGFARAFLAGSNMRVISRSLIIACVIQILMIELLFCTNATPLGIQLTFPTCLLFGLGFIIVTMLISAFLMVFIEWPQTRLIQLSMLPYLSHDNLLADDYRKKQSAKL